jgi:hypothetical protein
MEKFAQIYSDYSQLKISLTDFQLGLEAMLSNFDFLSKEDEEFILEVTNNLERIIFTEDIKTQKAKVDLLYPENIIH